jgi:hypothetical protein
VDEPALQAARSRLAHAAAVCVPRSPMQAIARLPTTRRATRAG